MKKLLVFLLVFLVAAPAFAGESTKKQLGELDKLVAACKADAATADACIAALRSATAKPVVPAGGDFQLDVVCDQAAALKAAKLGRGFSGTWVNDSFSPENYPAPPGCKAGSVSGRIFHFNRAISSEDAIKEMEKEGYRPATWPELRALAAAKPELQREFPIIALGSRWRSPLGGLDVPFLYGFDDGRGLGLDWFGLGWGSDSRFVAVRK